MALGMSSSFPRLIRTFAWLRWRLLVNTLKGGRRRDTLEHISRVASTILPIALAILIIPSFLLACALALIGGWTLGRGMVPVVGIVAFLRILLGAVCAAVVLAPAVKSIRGGSSGLTRFLLLPIPRAWLFVADSLSSVLDPWIALVVPILLLFPVGLAAAGRLGVAAIALGAGIAMLAAFIGLESSISYLLRLLYRSRRRGEMATLVVVFSLSLVGFVPLILTAGNHSWIPSRTRESGRADTGPERYRSIPVDPDKELKAPTDRAATLERGRRGSEGHGLMYLTIIPSEAYGQTIDLAVSNKPATASLTLALLAGMAVVFLGLAYFAHERLLDTPESGGRTRSSNRERFLGKRIPGLSATSSALAIVNVRLLLRSVQGKMAVYFTPVSFIVSMFILTRLSSLDVTGFLGASSGPAFAAAGMMFSLLSLQKIMMNLFAIDGAGLTLQLLAPISDRELIVGKTAAIGLLYSASLVFYLGVAFLVFPGASPGLWLAATLFGVSTYVLYAPFALMLSALFPKAADLSRIGKSGSPNQLAAFVGFLIVMPVIAPPLSLAGVLLWLTDSPAWVLGALGLWTILTVVVSIFLLRLCEAILESRRENLGLTAQGR